MKRILAEIRLFCNRGTGNDRGTEASQTGVHAALRAFAAVEVLPSLLTFVEKSYDRSF
ncbi:MAG TPA: hypothetical protein VGW37_07780 [Terriglobia bacterium]|nr:hypothetical protein [Terriglobia bacterium]